MKYILKQEIPKPFWTSGSINAVRFDGTNQKEIGELLEKYAIGEYIVVVDEIHPNFIVCRVYEKETGMFVAYSEVGMCIGVENGCIFTCYYSSIQEFFEPSGE